MIERARRPASNRQSGFRGVLEPSAFLLRVTRTLAFAAVVAMLGVAAGCGGPKAPSVASLGTTTTTGGTTSGAGAAQAAKPSTAALAQCFTSHGFPASIGSAATAGNRSVSVAGVVISGNVDPGSSQFQAAMQACRKYLPGGGPPSLTPAQQAAAAKAMLSFAACMRKNGVPNFPDPNGQGTFSPDSLQGLDPGTPLFQAAFKACQALEPKVGPRIGFGAGGGSQRTG